MAAPPESLTGDTRAGLLPRLIKLAPVTLPLALFGGVRAIRFALVDESETRETVGGSFWVVWFAVAALRRRFGQAGRAGRSTCYY